MAPNRLIHEKSPYLLQHAHNPVDWYAWSEEAFERARTENKPVLVSIGYATCHWCHVMEKESFEDEEAARYLNDTFVCIKVDREERPDIDAVYMAVCQMLTGSGGWPLNVFLTPDKKPFFAATYLPKHSRFGRTGLIELCRQTQNLWRSHKERVTASAESIAASLRRAFDYKPAAEPGDELLDEARRVIGRGFDARYGGFEGPPKFPMAHRLLLLLRRYHRHKEPETLAMVEKTLMAMRFGGIWDHVGFGFHRYATDSQWVVPHFEKMLYDQALNAQAYLEAYQISKNPFYGQTADEIFGYVLRDMTSPRGAFYSAEDADSEGEEGRFYVWSLEEFRKVAGRSESEPWERIFNLKPEGNFSGEADGGRTGANILHLEKPFSEWAVELGTTADELAGRWEAIRRRLFQARSLRVHPLKDDKILTDWNGLMIAALALGARVLNNPDYLRAAEASARFVLDRMRSSGGRLFHRLRDDHLAVDGQASDYAFLIKGLLNLYQSSFDLTYAETAAALQRQMLDDFWDEAHGGFFSNAEGANELPVRPKELYDGAVPSANSVSLLNLLWLARLTGDAEWDRKARTLVRSFSGTLSAQPSAFTYFLLGLDFALHAGQEVIIAGEPDNRETRELLSALNLNFAPGKIALVKSERNKERLARFAGFTGRLQPVQGKATAHVCRNFACKEPTTDAQRLIDLLAGK